MKKLIIILSIFLSSFAFADKLHVKALDNFSTLEPSENFRMELIEDGTMNGTYMLKGDILNCTLEKVTDPTRAKRDAKIYLNIVTYTDSKGEHEITPKLIGKYAKTALTKEEIKKTPPRKIVKKTASTVGNFFVQGFSYGVSFVDGLSENKEGNRIKSGAKQVYEDSFLSYVEYGQEVEIKEGDIFYLIVKEKKEEKDKKHEK